MSATAVRMLISTSRRATSAGSGAQVGHLGCLPLHLANQLRDRRLRVEIDVLAIDLHVPVRRRFVVVRTPVTMTTTLAVFWISHAFTTRVARDLPSLHAAILRELAHVPVLEQHGALEV
jgi:hypothetical protein